MIFYIYIHYVKTALILHCITDDMHYIYAKSNKIKEGKGPKDKLYNCKKPDCQ